MNLLIGCVLSYLIGSIPTAYIFGRLYKSIDIRQHGSGNVGATNVFRVLGQGPGMIALLIDILKGVIPVVVVANALGLHQTLDYILFSLCAVMGHNWTVFLNFKGGKGIATSLGVLIGMTIQMPLIRFVLLGTVLVWLVCFVLFRYVSLASIIAAAALPLLSFFTHQPPEFQILSLIFCAFVIWRHRPNIDRLRKGRESKVPLFLKKK